jgi:hypothetical protein
MIYQKNYIIIFQQTQQQIEDAGCKYFDPTHHKQTLRTTKAKLTIAFS